MVVPLDTLAVAKQEIGPQTVNHYVRAVRGFFRWLVAAKRIGANPLDTLALVNARVDVRRSRRELTADQLRVNQRIAQEAAARDAPLPPLYGTLFAVWTALGIPAFVALVVVFWLMVAKPT